MRARGAILRRACHRAGAKIHRWGTAYLATRSRMKHLLRKGQVLSMMFACAVLCAACAPKENSIIVASTTSTQDSGLFDYLLTIVKERTGITVKVVAQGTGQALDTARRGDADVVFVHAKAAELQFLAEGESLKRY